MQALFSKNISVKDIDIYPKEAYNKCIGSERIREKPKRQKQKRRIIMDAVDFFKTVNRNYDYNPEENCHEISCSDCKRKFWLTEVTDND